MHNSVETALEKMGVLTVAKLYVHAPCMYII